MKQKTENKSKSIKAFISHGFWIFKWFMKDSQVKYAIKWKPDANDESLLSKVIYLLHCCVVRWMLMRL